ncbi:hypothetical protein GGD38_003864 [Chitinophagaceae bacterium OAS944]|nr:hypothetical protein [Chitinophagaceae bacterium OAS944]
MFYSRNLLSGCKEGSFSLIFLKLEFNKLIVLANKNLSLKMSHKPSTSWFDNSKRHHANFITNIS